MTYSNNVWISAINIGVWGVAQYMLYIIQENEVGYIQ